MARTTEPPTLIRTQARLGAIFGVDQSTVSTWVRMEGFPGKRKGKWDAAEVGHWVKNYREVETGSLADERRRLTKEQADKEALRNAQARGELIAFADVERIWSQSYADLFAAVDKGFHHLAPKLSGLDAPGILSELQEWWNGAREKLGEEWRAS